MQPRRHLGEWKTLFIMILCFHGPDNWGAFDFITAFIATPSTAVSSVTTKASKIPPGICHIARRTCLLNAFTKDPSHCDGSQINR